MQKHLMMALGLILGVSSMAHAATPLTPQLLGQLDGILTYCTSIDPRDEQQFKKLRRTITVGAGERELEEKERHSGYRATFKLMHEVFRSMPPDRALGLCKDAVK